jgi:hypothetical protein
MICVYDVTGYQFLVESAVPLKKGLDWLSAVASNSSSEEFVTEVRAGSLGRP